MSDINFTILGTSSGMPQPGRACSGYVLQTGPELSLIDCGGGVSAAFTANGFDPLQVERVFISHTHPDHVSDLPLFIQMIYLAGRKKPVDIYLPEEFVEPFINYLRAVYLIIEKLPFNLNISGYASGFRYEKKFILKAIGNRHLLGYAPFIEKYKLLNKMQCHSFQLEVSGRTLFYSADVFDLEDIKGHLNNQDYVVIEPTHLDFDLFLKFIPQVSVGQYIITHLGTVEGQTVLKRAVEKAGLKNVVFAREGLRLELDS
ncbi:MAG: ribonuclease Z [candidate division Zixibacteria bacterium]|nr:ribonuclease Z [candidate division Zixibacteria bacterium]